MADNLAHLFVYRLLHQLKAEHPQDESNLPLQPLCGRAKQPKLNGNQLQREQYCGHFSRLRLLSYREWTLALGREIRHLPS